ncbi:fimbrial protein [Pseudomonas sp. BJa5]|uniref:fimbrial protein n=1 Tax=Pseudomonas sp. BJa5 TaxID=2936270 RepID=UPI002559C51B|nr:fimbrial protein [Pseudomonas sp. BGr12]MDL2421116.1 type 1 fimbrial protein [Pseudomonas sp. BGr12]
MIFPSALPDFFATTAASKSRSHLAAWALLLGSLSSQALADERTSCQFINGTGPQILTIDLPQRLVFDRNLPDGYIFEHLSASGPTVSIRCSAGWRLTHGFNSSMSLHSGFVYRTTVPGIGVRVQVLSVARHDYLHWPRHSEISQNTGSQHETPRFFLTLEKIGPITPGTLRLPVELGHVTAGALTTESLRLANSQIEVVENIPTCSVDAGSKLIPVFLGDHPRASFNGVNFTTPAMPFSIALNCSGGGPGSSRNVRFTITDFHYPENRTQALRLAPNAGAAGVGVRIRHHLNGATSTVAMGSSLAAGTVYPGVPRFAINLSAQYIQQVPPSQIREGLAPARARFNITYN